MRISYWSSDVFSSDLSPRRWNPTAKTNSKRLRRLRTSLPRKLRLRTKPKKPKLLQTKAFRKGRVSGWERGPFLVCEAWRSEEHTSELQSLMRISYAVFCLKKKKKQKQKNCASALVNTQENRVLELHELSFRSR